MYFGFDTYTDRYLGRYLWFQQTLNRYIDRFFAITVGSDRISAGTLQHYQSHILVEGVTGFGLYKRWMIN